MGITKEGATVYNKKDGWVMKDVSVSQSTNNEWTCRSRRTA